MFGITYRSYNEELLKLLFLLLLALLSKLFVISYAPLAVHLMLSRAVYTFQTPHRQSR